jgi:hypothetical protein
MHGGGENLDFSGGQDLDLSGGVLGIDAFGDKDLGTFPAKKNLPYTGVSRNEDYEQIKKHVKDPLYKSAEDSYVKLHKLYMQMCKTKMCEEKKIKLLEQVKQSNVALLDGNPPDWFVEYIEEIDNKIEQAEKAIQDKDTKLSASLEYQSAIEEKKLAYMIMEYLTNRNGNAVAVGSGERARKWRSERTRTGIAPPINRTYYTKAPEAAEAAEAAAAEASPAAAAAAAPRPVQGAAPNPSLGILNGLSFGAFGQPNNAQLAAQAQAAQDAAPAAAPAAAAQAAAAAPAAAAQAAAAAAQAAAAAPAAAAQAAAPVAGVLGAAVGAVQNLLGFGGPGQASNLSESASDLQARAIEDARTFPARAQAARAQAARAQAAQAQSVIDLTSGSPLPPAPRRGAAFVDLTSGSPAVDLTSGSPLLQPRSPLPPAPQRGAARLPRTRANPGSGLVNGLKGGAKKKRSSRSRKGKSRSRSHKKAKKHSM